MKKNLVFVFGYSLKREFDSLGDFEKYCNQLGLKYIKKGFGKLNIGNIYIAEHKYTPPNLLKISFYWNFKKLNSLLDTVNNPSQTSKKKKSYKQAVRYFVDLLLEFRSIPPDGPEGIFHVGIPGLHMMGNYSESENRLLERLHELIIKRLYFEYGYPRGNPNKRPLSSLQEAILKTERRMFENGDPINSTKMVFYQLKKFYPQFNKTKIRSFYRSHKSLQDRLTPGS